MSQSREPTDMKFYQDWRISRWQTPASDFGSVRRELLQDKNELVIIVQDGLTRERVGFNFSGERMYRNINETYLGELWKSRPQGLGSTWQVQNSDFWRGVTSDPWAEDRYRAGAEYVFLTEDDVIQVISLRAPTIEVLPPADHATKAPGLSEIAFKRRT